jgi:hypothetical protein
MREIVHLQAGQCGNQIGSKVKKLKIKKLKKIGMGWIDSVLMSQCISSFGK